MKPMAPMSDEALPAARGKGMSASAVAFGSTSAVPKSSSANGATIAAQCAAPAHANAAAAAPPASTRELPLRMSRAMPSRTTSRLAAQAPVIWPSITPANIQP